MLWVEHAVCVPVPGLVQAPAGGGLAPLSHRHSQLCHRKQVLISAPGLVQEWSD